jgi:glycosyltransferase involved in cell wall biosynthesis
MKVAILVDALINRGGAERLVFLLARDLQADIIAGVYTPDTTFDELRSCSIRTLQSGGRGKLTSLTLRRAFRNLRLQGYDAFISLGGASLEIARNHAPVLWYCNAPIRWAYDLYEEEVARRSFLARIPFMMLASWIRMQDQACVKRVKLIVSNSDNVGKRVVRFYPGRTATTVYPPIETHKFHWLKQGDFYVSTARLDPIKQVDTAIKAFLKMPDLKLIVASSGPDEQRLKTMAANAPNISFTGRVTEPQLAKLYGECIAALSPSHQEDFGMIPLESMSAGKPCIATNEGGYLETVLPEKTGLLIDPTDTDAFVKAVRWLDPKRAHAMRKDCEAQAKKFDTSVFLKRMREVLAQCVSSS